jgi:hypothetical protein
MKRGAKAMDFDSDIEHMDVFEAATETSEWVTREAATRAEFTQGCEEACADILDRHPGVPLHLMFMTEAPSDIAVRRPLY